MFEVEVGDKKVVVNLESQSYKTNDKLADMLCYAALLHRKYRCEVRGIMLLLDESPVVGNSIDFPNLVFKCEVVQFSRFDAKTWLDERDPKLAPFAILAEGKADGKIEGKIETARMMRQEGSELPFILKVTGLTQKQLQDAGVI